MTNDFSNKQIKQNSERKGKYRENLYQFTKMEKRQQLKLYKQMEMDHHPPS